MVARAVKLDKSFISSYWAASYLINWIIEIFHNVCAELIMWWPQAYKQGMDMLVMVCCFVTLTDGAICTHVQVYC